MPISASCARCNHRGVDREGSPRSNTPGSPSARWSIKTVERWRCELLPTPQTHLTATAAVPGSELAGWECTDAAGTITLNFGTDTSGQPFRAATTLVPGPMPILRPGTSATRPTRGGSIRVGAVRLGGPRERLGCLTPPQMEGPRLAHPMG